MTECLNQWTNVLQCVCLFYWIAEPGFRGLNPPVPWEHAPRPHFPLVPASWPYGLHQNFMHQGNPRFQPNKPFYSQGTVSYKSDKKLGFFYSGTGSLSQGQNLGVKIHAWSKDWLRMHAVCQITFRCLYSSKSKRNFLIVFPRWL